MILGVDPQPSSVMACLREGPVPNWPPPSLRDGWASARGLDPTQAWASLHARLARFLGDGELARGARLVVIDQPEDLSAPGLADGFGGLTLVCAGRAALISAIQEMGWAQRIGGPFRLVVVNETWVGVYGYRLSDRGMVSLAATPIHIRDTGSAFWVNEVVRGITARFSEDAPDGAEPHGLQAAASEIGQRLADAPNDDFAVAWRGVEAAKASSIPMFTRRLCARWVSVRRLAELLPQALVEIDSAIAGPSPILLAGVGAEWPFAAQIASGQGRVQTLADPSLALARGAAWWPEVGEALFSDLAETDLSAPAREAAKLHPSSHNGIDLDLLARLAERSEPKP